MEKSEIENRKSQIPPGVPPITRRTLPNGVRLAIAESRASDTVVLSGMFVGGAVLDPPGLAGLANFTAAVAQRATTDLTYEQIYNRLDHLGASMSMGAGTHATSFRAKCLSRHWPTVAELLTGILRRPSFPAEEFAKARGELLTTLREFDDSTRVVSGRELSHLVYPEGHPYRPPSYGYRGTVEGLRPSDLAACHERLFRPDRLILSVVGNVETEGVLEAIGGLFGDWARPPEPVPEPDLSATAAPEARRVSVPMADKSQSDLALGFKCIPRRHADFYALDQATQIVGGMGLMGRLGDNVRDRQGLAYYVYASMQESFGDGLWSVYAGVNPANVERAIQGILGEVRRIQDESAAEQELADVQSYLVGVLPIRLETNDGLAGMLNGMELFGLGDDYLERYPTLVRSVTREDVQRAAQAHLTAERYCLAIAGPPAPEASPRPGNTR